MNGKIAISSKGEKLESEIDFRFGRCPYFIIVDIKNNEIKNFEAVRNENSEQTSSAGISAAEAVAKKGVNMVITGSVGPRANEVFKQFKIDVYISDGKVGESVKKLTEGVLEKFEK